MTQKNTAPATIWEALRRLRACNKSQLAKSLGVDRSTLRLWELATEAGKNPGTAAHAKASALLIATLRAANDADALAQWRIGPWFADRWLEDYTNDLKNGDHEP